MDQQTFLSARFIFSSLTFVRKINWFWFGPFSNIYISPCDVINVWTECWSRDRSGLDCGIFDSSNNTINMTSYDSLQTPPPAHAHAGTEWMQVPLLEVWFLISSNLNHCKTFHTSTSHFCTTRVVTSSVCAVSRCLWPRPDVCGPLFLMHTRCPLVSRPRPKVHVKCSEVRWEQDDLSADLESSKHHICAGRGLNTWRKLQMVEERRGGGSIIWEGGSEKMAYWWGEKNCEHVESCRLRPLCVYTGDGEWEGQQLKVELSFTFTGHKIKGLHWTAVKCACC